MEYNNLYEEFLVYNGIGCYDLNTWLVGIQLYEELLVYQSAMELDVTT